MSYRKDLDEEQKNEIVTELFWHRRVMEIDEEKMEEKRTREINESQILNFRE